MNIMLMDKEKALIDIDHLFLSVKDKIEAWFENQWQTIDAPFYCSTDLRRSGYKLAPVDTNLFPGGYNNLNPLSYPKAAQAAKKAVLARAPDARRILIVPENHTRNEFYLSNVVCLRELLEQAGFDVRVGSLIADITEPTTLSLKTGQQITLEPLIREQNKLVLPGFVADAILLNNDLSSGVPDIIKGLSGQVQLVNLHGGWWHRRKSMHFEHYRQVAKKFADAIGIDPWLIDPYFGVCKQVDFQKRLGEPCLAEIVDNMLKKIQLKYNEYGITEKPYLILKADAGTYGMGVMAIHDASEVVNLNRKQRNKMSVIKDGVSVQEVLVQEGVRTVETVDGSTAESVMYLFGEEAVGGFYRINRQRNADDNLNSSGMEFVPFGSEEACMKTKKCYANSVVGRLAAMGAGTELAELSKEDAL